jgi:hypothetical protein
MSHEPTSLESRIGISQDENNSGGEIEHRLLEAHPSKPVAQSYLRTSHMAQPASSAPPRNMAKQYRP